MTSFLQISVLVLALGCVTEVVSHPKEMRGASKRVVAGTANEEGLFRNIENVELVSRSQFDPIDAPGCGQRPLVANNGVDELVLGAKIVGGAEAVAYSWPFICSFRSSASPTSHMCGANLVKNLDGQYYVITAAHCTSNRQASRYVTYCGIYDTASSSHPHRFIVSFSTLVVHSQYNSWTLDNDIAALRPSTQPPTNNQISPVCIPNEGWREGELAIVAGWGTLSSGGFTPYRLHQVTKPIKSREVCRQRYGTSSITNSMVCAGVPEGGIDSCQGDSGGPLYTYREGRWTLTGIVSWGYGCAEAGRPGVYADSFALKSWINSVINA